VLFGLTVLASENKTATLFCERKLFCFIDQKRKVQQLLFEAGKNVPQQPKGA